MPETADRPVGPDDARRRARRFLLERFDDFLGLEEGAADRTREAYARDLDRFVEWCLPRGVASPSEVSPRLVRDYVYFLKDLGLAPASIRRAARSSAGWRLRQRAPEE